MPSPLTHILSTAVNAKASDIHIHAGQSPVFRINTQLTPSDLPPVSIQETRDMLAELLNDKRRAAFEELRDADFSYSIPSVGRFRVNVHYQRGGLSFAFRAIQKQVRPLEQLFLPEICKTFTKLNRGLVLVTGGTGSGKSTTLAAMIDSINRNESHHIITIEDPIEYTFSDDNSIIEQREVGSDVPSFASGLRHVLRQDPDVILVGEMRDLETTRAAVSAAETGHLVFSTLHTGSAAQTVERIIEQYPAGEQNQIRSMLASSLQAVVSQTLIKRCDEPGMIPAVEVMVCTAAVRSCIRENRIHEIQNIIGTSRAQGMVSLDDAIRELYVNGYISREDALASAMSPEKLDRALAA